MRTKSEKEKNTKVGEGEREINRSKKILQKNFLHYFSFLFTFFPFQCFFRFIFIIRSVFLFLLSLLSCRIGDNHDAGVGNFVQKIATNKFANPNNFILAQIKFLFFCFLFSLCFTFLFPV